MDEKRNGFLGLGYDNEQWRGRATVVVILKVWGQDSRWKICISSELE